MTGTVLRWLACLGAALGACRLCGDGIALSIDGLLWSKGAGGYGDGWGYSGTGVSVEQGGTLYIKYYSVSIGSILAFDDHGRRQPGWHPIGPALVDGIGANGAEPVILRITDIGTPKCVVAWINGPGRSGIWSGPQAPGPYDLALNADARWTLPPIVVTEAPKRPSFWSRLLGPGGGASDPGGDKPRAVPDGGSSMALFIAALAALAIVRSRLS